MPSLLHVGGYVLIALFFPAPLWLFATGGTWQGVRAVFAAWSALWRRMPRWLRVLWPLGLLGLWTVAVVLSATWGQSGPGADWRLGLRQCVIQFPLWISLQLLGPQLANRLRDR